MALLLRLSFPSAGERAVPESLTPAAGLLGGALIGDAMADDGGGGGCGGGCGGGGD